ncbi:membrane-associated protein, putative [Bodo saltans]|uniref:Membrane-associated protein, putative n=1 Tax=Bodo saltans TaxID=75058 RepID=A0A0S4JEL2_BODSA|nr:membrane-associated protein, putative [Bodo saltans]|eukprot:CUG88558.1 membrane-associated protein, putative [Bodo saltans]
MKWGDRNVVVATRMTTTRSFSLVARFFLLCVVMSSSAVVADDSGSSTSSSTIAPMKYYYGNDNASVLPWETVTVLVLLFLFAVVLEYGLATLKDQEGTYTRIVAASVLQETLIIGLVSMFLLGLLTVVGIQPLYVLCVRSTSAGLILMVFVFIILILLLTAGLVWSRKVWGVFERSRMAAENIRGGIRYRRKAGDEEEIVNRDDDEVDEEDDAKRRGRSGKVLLSGAAAAAAPSVVANQEYHVSAAVRRYVQPSTTLVRRTAGNNYHDDDDLDDDHHNLGTTRTSMSMLDMHTPSRFQSPGAQSPRTPASPSAGGGQIPLSSRISGGGGGGGRSGEGRGLVHRPLPLSATRAPLVLPYDMMDAAEQEAVDRELADALIGDGPIMMLMAAQRGGGGGAGNGDGGGTMRRRRMFGFSSREKIFTRCRDLWMETIIRKRLLNRQVRPSPRWRRL